MHKRTRLNKGHILELGNTCPSKSLRLGKSCFVMSCHVMSRHVTSCRVVSFMHILYVSALHSWRRYPYVAQHKPGYLSASTLQYILRVPPSPRFSASVSHQILTRAECGSR